MVDRTDEEQIEALKEWWRENGKAVILGLMIGVGAIGGWRLWDSYQESRALEASAVYQKLQAAVRDNQNESVREHGRQLIDNYAGTPYAAFASLALARLAVEEGDLERAERLLHGALKNAPESSIQHVARLRLIQVQIAQDKLNAALGLIESTNFGGFTARYEELRGDVLLAQGQPEAARQAYSTALTNTPPQSQGRELLTTKLESVGVSTSDGGAPE